MAQDNTKINGLDGATNDQWQAITGTNTPGCTGGASLGIGAQVCPHCGKCPVCGRGGYPYPQVWYSTPQVYCTSTSPGAGQWKCNNE